MTTRPINAEYARIDEEEMRDLAPMFERMAAAGRPYLVHIAKYLGDEGRLVSPLCAGDDVPRPLGDGEMWVYSPNNYRYVTCPSCMAAAGEVA